MRTNPISTQPLQHQNINTSSSKVNHDKTIDAKNDKLENVTFESHTQENFGTYKIDTKKLAEIKQDFARRTESFKEMVRTLLEKQGLTLKEVTNALDKGETPLVTIDEETKLSAQEAISENGYWGVTQTSERILEFAKTVSGGDPSKIDTLINAFKEGYEEAKKAFGGELPEISNQTYEKVMEGFEAWKNEK